jgi:hypothetical protein
MTIKLLNIMVIIALITCAIVLIIASFAKALSHCCCFSDESVEYIKI